VTDRVEHLDDGRVVALALGELTGRERADALQHLVACRTCRDDVDSLVAVSDEVLLLAPQAEPSAGFESAVLDRFEFAEPERSRARSRVSIVAAVAAVIAFVVAGAVVVGVVAGREEGPALAEAPMITPTGLEVGRAWSTGSDPAWILVSVPSWNVWDESAGSPGEYWVRVELDDGSTTELGPVEFHGDTGSWAMTTSLATEDIRSVAVVDSTGRVWCAASFEA
jgi:hypothetical protein